MISPRTDTEGSGTTESSVSNFGAGLSVAPGTGGTAEACAPALAEVSADGGSFISKSTPAAATARQKPVIRTGDCFRTGERFIIRLFFPAVPWAAARRFVRRARFLTKFCAAARAGLPTVQGRRTRKKSRRVAAGMPVMLISVCAPSLAKQFVTGVHVVRLVDCSMR